MTQFYQLTLALIDIEITGRTDSHAIYILAVKVRVTTFDNLIEKIMEIE